MGTKPDGTISTISHIGGYENTVRQAYPLHTAGRRQPNAQVNLDESVAFLHSRQRTANA
jgi:hypothetical protein